MGLKSIIASCRSINLPSLVYQEPITIIFLIFAGVVVLTSPTTSAEYSPVLHYMEKSRKGAVALGVGIGVGGEG